MDAVCKQRLVSEIRPHEIYNHLAAMLHVEISFQILGQTAETDGLGILYFLDDAIK